MGSNPSGPKRLTQDLTTPCAYTSDVEMGYRRSSVPNLYRDERTEIYYVRTKVHGRTIWKTLQTNEFRVAKLRAPKELGSLQKGRNALSSLEKGSATFGNLAELYKVRIQPRKSGDLITPHSDGLVELYRFVVGHRLELRNVSW